MNIINRRLYTFGGELFTNNNAITRAGFDCLFLSIYVILEWKMGMGGYGEHLNRGI